MLSKLASEFGPPWKGAVERPKLGPAEVAEVAEFSDERNDKPNLRTDGEKNVFTIQSRQDILHK